MEETPLAFVFTEGKGAVSVEDIPCAPAEEVPSGGATVPGVDDTELVDVTDALQLRKGRISSETAATLLGQGELSFSDLIPGKYEGGFKLWEGAIDLCQYLLTKYGLSEDLFASKQGPALSGKKVLELGCGHGLPGIVCLLAGAEVHFQDYNKPVLSALTIPNVRANIKLHSNGRASPPTRYFSGDWLNVGSHLTSCGLSGYYDVVMTSEAIYNSKNQYKLLELMKQVVKPPHGIILVASKSYYFGVGGGLASFRNVVKEDGIFEVESVFRVADGPSGNVREILSLKFPEAITPYFL